MGYHARKSKGRRSGSIQHTEMELKRVGWRLRNDIAVMVSPNWDGPETEWLVEIRINGRTYFDPTIYTATKAHEKKYEYYKYYYDKYNK